MHRAPENMVRNKAHILCSLFSVPHGLSEHRLIRESILGGLSLMRCYNPNSLEHRVETQIRNSKRRFKKKNTRTIPSPGEGHHEQFQMFNFFSKHKYFQTCNKTEYSFILHFHKRHHEHFPMS